MKNNLMSNPLLVALMNRSPLSWRWTTIAVAFLLLLSLLIAGILDGDFNLTLEGDFWRIAFQAPAIIIYILFVYPFMWRSYKPSIGVFGPLLTKKDFDKRIAVLTSLNRKNEWLAVLGGFAFTVALSQPWAWVTDWLSLHVLVTEMVMFGMLGWLVYTSIKGSQVISILSKQQLKLDIFNNESLSPVARQSLATSFAFIGGISISLLFQTQETLLSWTSIVIYSILVVSTVLVFFVSIWGLHRIMSKAKQSELEKASGYLRNLPSRLQLTTSTERYSENLPSAVAEWAAYAGWAAYEKRVKEVSEWPFNVNIIRRLFASVLIPGLVYLLKVFTALGLKFT